MASIKRSRMSKPVMKYEYFPEVMNLYSTERFQKILRLVTTQTKGGPTYGAIMRPTIPVKIEFGTIRSDDGKYIFNDGSGEIEFTPREFNEKGELVVPLLAVKELNKVLQKVYSSGDSFTKEEGIQFLGESEETRNRVVIILPMRSTELSKDSSILQTVLKTVEKRIGASVMVCEIEPTRDLMNDTEILSVLGESITVANRILQDNTPSSVRRLIVIPSKKLIEGKYSTELLSKTLYDTIINRERNDAWVGIETVISTDTVKQTGMDGDILRCRVVGRSETVLQNSVPVKICRMRVVGSIKYPSGHYALNPKNTPIVFDNKQFAKTVITKYKLPKDSVVNALRYTPKNVRCFSSDYKLAMMGRLYQICRLMTIKKGKENPKLAYSLMKDLTEEMIVCGESINVGDLPNDTKLESVLSCMDGKYSRSLVGTVVNDGTGYYIVIAEDIIAGLSFVIPYKDGSLISEGRIVPMSYLYQTEEMSKKSTPTVILPGAGIHEYLCMWNYKDEDLKRQELPYILERCYFTRKDGSSMWKSIDGEVSLYYQTEKGYRGWVLNVKDKEYKQDTGSSSTEVSSWCGAYEQWMVSTRIGDPLEAIAAQMLRSVTRTETELFKDIVGDVDIKNIGLIEKLYKSYKQPREILQSQTYVYQLFVKLLDSYGVVVPYKKGEDVKKYLSTLEKRSIQNVRTSEFRKYFDSVISVCEDEFARRLGLFAVYPKKHLMKGSVKDASFLKNKTYNDEMTFLTKTIFDKPGNLGNGLRYLIEESNISVLGKTLFRSNTPAKIVYHRDGATMTTLRFPSSEEQQKRITFLSSSSNPSYRKMDHFVTFAGDESQIVQQYLQLWASYGSPRLKYGVTKTKGSMAKIYENIVKKTNIPRFTGINREDILRGIQYAFHKLRIGLFVSIRNNAMVVFAPMVNVGYENAYPRTEEFWFGKGMTQKDYLSSKNSYLKAIGMRSEKYEPIHKWFVNNSLVGNMFSANYTGDHSMPIVLDMLRETVKYRKVSDCDFLVNTRDFPKMRADGRDPDHAVYGLPVEKSMPMFGYQWKRNLPVVGFNTHPLYLDVGIPVPDDWKSACGGFYGKDTKGSVEPTVAHPLPITKEQWEKRTSGAIFRGSATGFSSLSPVNQRVLLAEMTAKDDSYGERYLNVALTSGAIRDRKVDVDGMKYLITPGEGSEPNTIAVIQKGERASLRTPLVKGDDGEWKAPEKYTEQDAYQMVLYVDGNAAAYRYSSLMAAGFAILRVASRVGYEMWFYPGLKNALPGSDDPEKIAELLRKNPEDVIDKDGDHIMIDADMKTLMPIIEWAIANPEYTRRIAENSVKRYNEWFTKSSLMDTMSAVMNGIAVGQTWTERYKFNEITTKMIEEPLESKQLKNSLRLKEKREVSQIKLREKLEMVEDRDEKQEEIGITNMTRASVGSVSKVSRMDVPKDTLRGILDSSITTRAERLTETVGDTEARVKEVIKKKKPVFIHKALQNVVNRIKRETEISGD